MRFSALSLIVFIASVALAVIAVDSCNAVELRSNIIKEHNFKASSGKKLSPVGTSVCSTYGFAQCLADTYCFWNGTQTGGYCEGALCEPFFDEYACVYTYPCMYVNHHCYTDCFVRKSQTQCIQGGVCVWEMENTTSYKCHKRCEDYQDIDICPLYRCWQPVGTDACATPCANYADELSCAQHHTFCWFDPTLRKCTDKCRYRYNAQNISQAVQCRGDDKCFVGKSSVTGQSECFNKICGFSTQLACEANKKYCSWQAPNVNRPNSYECLIQPCAASDSSICSQISGCAWNQSEQFCEQKP